MASHPVGVNGNVVSRSSRAQAASAFNILDKVDVSFGALPRSLHHVFGAFALIGFVR